MLCVNTTELGGLTEARVQQVLRLLPRGLVKLVVSTHPPPPSPSAQGKLQSASCDHVLVSFLLSWLVSELVAALNQEDYTRARNKLQFIF